MDPRDEIFLSDKGKKIGPHKNEIIAIIEMVDNRKTSLFYEVQ